MPGDEEMDKTGSFFREPTIGFRGVTGGKLSGPQGGRAEMLPRLHLNKDEKHAQDALFMEDG